MLSVSITILTVLLVVVSIFIILIVLMQRPKQEGLGAAFGGGMMNDIAGAHTTDILQKGTVWLSVMFFSISILLGVLYTKQIADKNNVKVLDGVKAAELPPPPGPSIGEIPGAPPVAPVELPGGVSIEMPPKTESEPGPAAGDDGKAKGKGKGKGESEEGGEDAPKPGDSSEKTDSTGQPDPSPAPSGDKPEPPTDSPPSSGASKGNPGPASPPSEGASSEENPGPETGSPAPDQPGTVKRIPPKTGKRNKGQSPAKRVRSKQGAIAE